MPPVLVYSLDAFCGVESNASKVIPNNVVWALMWSFRFLIGHLTIFYTKRYKI